MNEHPKSLELAQIAVTPEQMLLIQHHWQLFQQMFQQQLQEQAKTNSLLASLIEALADGQNDDESDDAEPLTYMDGTPIQGGR
jgi:hypothetical protein